MSEDKVLHIHSATKQTIEILTKDSRKVVCLLSPELKILYVSGNLRYALDLPQNTPLDTTQLLTWLTFSADITLEMACQTLQQGEIVEYPLEGILQLDGKQVGFHATLQTPTNQEELWLILRFTSTLFEELQIQKKLIENTSDVIAYYDATEQPVYISPSAFQLTGYTPQELMGMPAFALAHSEDRERLQGEIAKDIAQNSPEYRFKYRIQHKAGHFLWVEAVSRRNYDAEGRFKEAILNFRSIQEQVEIEERLKASEVRYKGIVNQAPFGVIIHDLHVILFVNDAAAKILKAENKAELIGKNVFEFIHTSSHSVVEQRIERLKSGSSAPLSEQILLRLDGAAFEAEIMSGPVEFRGKECHTSGFLGYFPAQAS